MGNDRKIGCRSPIQDTILSLSQWKLICRSRFGKFSRWLNTFPKFYNVRTLSAKWPGPFPTWLQNTTFVPVSPAWCQIFHCWFCNRNSKRFYKGSVYSELEHKLHNAPLVVNLSCLFIEFGGILPQCVICYALYTSEIDLRYKSKFILVQICLLNSRYALRTTRWSESSIYVFWDWNLR